MPNHNGGDFVEWLFRVGLVMIGATALGLCAVIYTLDADYSELRQDYENLRKRVATLEQEAP